MFEWMNFLRSQRKPVQRKDEDPCILILEPETMKYETDKANIDVPVQPEQINSEEDVDNEEVEPKDNDHIIPRYVRLNHNLEHIIGDKDVGVLTRRRIRENSCMISTIEPRTAKEAFGDDHWVKDMEEELDQIEKNNTWTLVTRLVNKNVIGTKWVFRNKLNEDGVVVHNKAMVVCKVYAQEEGEDYFETFALVARLEGAKNLLAFTAHNKFKVYQMDVKSTFFNGILEEEVYIEHPNGYALTDKKDMVLKTFGISDYKPFGTPMVIGCKLSKEDESKSIDEKEYKSMIGKLHYVVHSRSGIAHAIGIVARFQMNPKETHLIAMKRIFRYLKGTIDYGIWYPYGEKFDLKVYTNANWAGNVDDQKNTTGGAFFLGGRLVSLSSKK
ncbi:hypothetical protein SUGI_0783140 [Cryptomeria japonica]|nr:hypothetical protein SUGI_0783140 [Cryptomeria japonica]